VRRSAWSLTCEVIFEVRILSRAQVRTGFANGFVILVECIRDAGECVHLVVVASAMTCVMDPFCLLMQGCDRRSSGRFRERGSACDAVYDFRGCDDGRIVFG